MRAAEQTAGPLALEGFDGFPLPSRLGWAKQSAGPLPLVSTLR